MFSFTNETCQELIDFIVKDSDLTQLMFMMESSGTNNYNNVISITPQQCLLIIRQREGSCQSNLSESERETHKNNQLYFLLWLRLV